MFNLNVMLADMARVASGKLDVWGGGWSWITPGAPFAIFGKIDLPWHLRQEAHTLRLELVDTDGAPFVLPDGNEVAIDHPPYDPTWIEGSEIKPGTAIDWPFAVNLIGLPLEPGTRYEWRIVIDGHTAEGWTLPFSTRAAEPDSLAA
jgi:hypothetical protein